uniref:Uncharacterized protein n=1 Tax=Ixodes ricinus TaxID=34613 RepID=A0A147BUX9_IXORI
MALCLSSSCVASMTTSGTERASRPPLRSCRATWTPSRIRCTVSTWTGRWPHGWSCRTTSGRCSSSRARRRPRRMRGPRTTPGGPPRSSSRSCRRRSPKPCPSFSRSPTTTPCTTRASCSGTTSVASPPRVCPATCSSWPWCGCWPTCATPTSSLRCSR